MPRMPGPTRAAFEIVLGAGGVAAFSALMTAIVAPPAQAPTTSATTAPIDQTATVSTVSVQAPVQYVQLQPGQSAPPGATVIDAAAPKPITVVTQVPAPPPKTIIVHTTQSGKIVP